MESINEQITRISEKLGRVATCTPSNVFGVEGHRFLLHQPLEVPDVERFEAKYQVKLPVGYRAFITQVANGGAGPAYGMFSLECALRCRLTESPIDVVPDDILKFPFQHTSADNPARDDEVIAMFEQADPGEITLDELDQYQLYLLYLTAGTLALCHEGCGYLHRLVVSGPTRGQMWLDGEVSEQGYYPLGVSFLEWYEKWLDDVIAGGRGTWWFNA
ncbi:hypothetical protein C7B80_01660 [Cyanosarcina cf. burmensis CCALA 770]|jgi:hypothetical protein|nr:hypothetical protein C7B80_01660 [Cyanosarcina cf. burmensis CCALA 770]